MVLGVVFFKSALGFLEIHNDGDAENEYDDGWKDKKGFPPHCSTISPISPIVQDKLLMTFRPGEYLGKNDLHLTRIEVTAMMERIVLLHRQLGDRQILKRADDSTGICFKACWSDCFTEIGSIMVVRHTLLRSCSTYSIMV